MKHSAKSKALIIARMKANEKVKAHVWGGRSRGPWDKRARKADGGAVTDPDILAQLNADGPKPVSDPAILEQLNGSPKTSWSDAITDIPAEIGRTASENYETIKKGLFPSGQGSQGQIEHLMNTGKAVAAIPGLIASPITGAARSLIGHPMAQLEHKAGELIAPDIAAKDDPQKMYETAKGDVDLAMSAMAPKGGLKPLPSTAPPPLPPQDTLGVTLSEGQRTGELPAIRNEQAALRGQSGAGAEEQAKAFAEQQQQQLAQAKQNVSKSLDPASQVMAENPADAAELAANTVRQEAARAKQGVNQAYRHANNQPGEFSPDVFNGIGSQIKNRLAALDEPVVVDTPTTPNAAKALDYIDNTISRLRIPNKTDLSEPDTTSIAGVNLKGVEQIRKALSGFRKDALGNPPDQRAMRAIIDQYDKHIDDAVNQGLFNGDPYAVKAWNAARAAHSDYMQTFGKGKNDPVGRVVEKILGTQNNPAAIPNDVADFMYGSTGTNASSLNVGVAKRIKGILGESSPEWSAVRQGLFERATANAGSDKIVTKLNKLLNEDGRELSEAVFTPSQRDLLQQFADLHEKLKIPTGGVNRSETSTFVAPMMKKLTAGVAAVVGAMLGHTLAPGAYGVGELIGAGLLGKGSTAISDITKARKIANQMPLVADRMRAYQRALINHQRGGAPSTAGLSVASTNLAKALGGIGFDYGKTLRMLQGPVPAGAEDKQQ